MDSISKHSDRFVEPTFGGSLHVGAPARAVISQLGQVGESPDQMVDAHMGQSEGTDARGVHNRASGWQGQEYGAGGGVASAPGHFVDVPGGPLGLGDQGIDQCRLAHPAVPDQHAGMALESSPQWTQVATTLGHHPRNSQGFVVGHELVRSGEIGLGQAEQRSHAGVEGGDQGSVDQTSTRFGIGQGGHDDQLIDIGHDHSFDGISVIGSTTQHRGALLDGDDPAQ